VCRKGQFEGYVAGQAGFGEAASHRSLRPRVPVEMPEAQKRRTACLGATTREGLGDGRGAPTPAQIPARGWGQLLVRSFSRVCEDRLLGEAAAVAFYALLAAFPALAALVTLCGLFVDPEAAAGSLQPLAGMLPSGTADVARDALARIAAQGGGRAGLAAALAIAALWSAAAASMQLFGALNVAYREPERRDRVRLCGIALVFAVCAMAFVALALGGVLAVPAALGAAAGVGARPIWFSGSCAGRCCLPRCRSLSRLPTATARAGPLRAGNG
jgi:membrane protein